LDEDESDVRSLGQIWKVFFADVLLQDDEDEEESDSDDGQPRRAPAAPKKKGEAEKADECKNQ
jgi:hypothetical protein